MAKFFKRALDRTLSVVGLERRAAASSALPEPAPIKKQKAGGRSVSSFLTSRNMPSELMTPMDRNLAYTDISRIDKTQGTRKVVRDLAHASPDFSAAVFSYIRTAITKNYSAVARNRDGSFNREATELAWMFLNRFDMLPDFEQGFVGTNTSLRGISESLSKEMMMYGGMSGELILDKSLIPVSIRPLSITNIQFKPKGNRLIPVQRVGGDDIELDTPAFKYIALDQELMEAYPSSPLESGIQPTLFNEEFFTLLRRAVRRALYPRLHVELDEESIRKFAPPEAMHDAEKMQDYIDDIVAEIEDQMNSLDPEDVIIHQDYIKVSMLNNGNISLSRELEVLKELADSKTSTAARAPAAILGHNVGSSNIASTETLLFMKNVEGAVQTKLNEFYSYMLTLSVRLVGYDCLVEFKYEDISLRPEIEQESFKGARQSRILEQLSLGLITDEDASLILTGFLPHPDAPKLSGTMFMSKKASGENLYGDESNSGSTLNQNLNPDTPTGSRGRNNKRNPVKENE